MSLKLYMHPLSSFCQKAVVAFYENATPFEPVLIDLGDEASRAELLKLWPLGKFPVLRDEARDWTVPESSIIIEYLDQHYPGAARLVPKDADPARQVRMRDRFFDLHVQVPMQKIMDDARRRPDSKDPDGVRQAEAALRTAYAMIDQDMAARTWAIGEAFSMADCAAAPALFYANRAAPIGEAHRHVRAYLDRLMARPSYARVLDEARPYFSMLPK
ncbi:MAG: glutathione S-transferase family protein [Caulobacterales bacterium]